MAANLVPMPNMSLVPRDSVASRGGGGGGASGGDGQMAAEDFLASSSRPPTNNPSSTSSSSSSKPPKSRRKISMPWFRQSSFGMSLARLRLPKQHTIAASSVVDEDADDVGSASSSCSGSGVKLSVKVRKNRRSRLGQGILRIDSSC